MDDQHAGRACETCRQRRVKCDKRLPGCARCEKLGQPCSGYKTERRFFDDGAKVRRKFGEGSEDFGRTSPFRFQSTPQSSPKPPTASRPSTGPAPGSFFNTILGETHTAPAAGIKHDRSPEVHVLSPPLLPKQYFSANPQNTTALPQPRPSLFPQRTQSTTSEGKPQPLTIPATDPHANPPTAQLLGNYNAYDVAAEVGVDPGPDEDFFDLDLDSYYANGNNACGFIPGLPVIMSDINDIDPNETDTYVGGDNESIASSLHSSSIKARSTRRRIGRAEADDRGQETAMLLRHFVEMMAPWMDILDIDGYFSRVMPLKATDNVMLRSALAAVAAKRIASVGGTRDKDLLTAQVALNRNVSDQNPEDWFYKAASYYDKAISHLRLHLHRLAQAPIDDQTLPLLEQQDMRGSIDRRFSSASEDASRPAKRRRAPPSHTRDTEIDDLLSAISVFSLYESLDNASVGFSQHLNGMQSLLEDKFRSRRMSGGMIIQPIPRSDKAATAAFWNFAREDLLTAYSSRQMTRLNTSDIALWKAAGLPVEPEDFANSGTVPLLDRLLDLGSETGNEEVFVAVLIWILMRGVNLVNSEHVGASSASEVFGTPQTSSSPGSTESMSPHAQQWQGLRGLLDGWYESLPITFDPYAELDYEPEEGHPHLGIKKLFYSLPLAAAALSLYHFGQILLILNQPMEVMQSRTTASRVRFLRAMTEESQSHARQVCGIALGGPPAAVQRQLAQPLHLAGLCFEDDKDRELVLKLLQEISLGSNCQTKALMNELQTEWGWVQPICE